MDDNIDTCYGEDPGMKLGAWIFILCILVGCEINSKQSDPVAFTPPSITEQDSTFTPPQSGIMAPLSEAEFNQLTPLQKYQVINLFIGSLYKGIAAKDYFDLSRGTDNLVAQDKTITLTELHQQLKTPTADFIEIISKAKAYYFTRPDQKERNAPLELPFVYLYELPLSKDSFDLWMAYQLTNTILFSPALELDSTNDNDVKNVLSQLNEAIKSDTSIPKIVYNHMISVENWRRFRSPEDNTREMLEIYLSRFIDEEVPKAAKACQNWKLSDEDENYQLIIGINVNDQPQNLLDSNHITTCKDFYRALAGHPRLIPTIVFQLVNYLFAYATPEKKSEIASALVNHQPTTFRDIFSTILFSKEYLLHSPRIRRIEETFFNTAYRIDWRPNPMFFRFLTEQTSAASLSRITLRQIHQEPMSYKLGRPISVPVDTLSFAYFHGLIRNSLMIKQPLNEFDSGWQNSFYEDPEVDQLSTTQFIDYVFITAIARKPDTAERETLLDIIQSIRKNDSKLAQSRLILDYLSRLPELYYMDSIDNIAP